MAAIESQERLLQLARSREPADRERLLLALAELCQIGGEAAGQPSVQALLSSIFLSLVVEAERDMRRRLAEKLSKAEWAPSALINVLALDEIEVARPIIAASPVLKDEDLIRLLLEATIEHQIEVARRPKLGAQVVAAILRQAEPAVLTALAGNATAELSDADMRALVAEARRVAALRAPLAQHPRLTSELALQLYVWLGQAMRQSLTERFRLDTEALDRALAETVREAHGGVRAQDDGLVVVAREGERQEMERRLVDKLLGAGQLRAGYLVRALREGRLSLFAAALSKLGGLSPEQVRLALDAATPDPLQQACAAIGIDRSAFPSILLMVRGLNGGRPGGDAGSNRPRSGILAQMKDVTVGGA
ncbi:MAG TPA: DUF2336 domain-containing protein [Phenylobacterium sp.]|uniref:DUF2336 domain-containing protein n=1 Tax=Phenylobacterium sp. TaxID=1871053 RepID=UPI002B470888|nr:DUF2336 domain-containing protein [Phenylobacterium sp.]HKR87272.1 DUF2336 domain-containing protein [Phenylobacterium sp.]